MRPSPDTVSAKTRAGWPTLAFLIGSPSTKNGCWICTTGSAPAGARAVARASRPHEGRRRLLAREGLLLGPLFQRRDLRARLKRFDYEYRTAGKNVALGPGSSGSPDSTLNNRTGSTGHKANVLDKYFRKIYGNAPARIAGFGARAGAGAPTNPDPTCRRLAGSPPKPVAPEADPRPRRDPSRSGRAPRRPGTGDLAPRVPSGSRP
jgi:hypothetical protein